MRGMHNSAAGSRRATSPGGRVPEGGWRTTPSDPYSRMVSNWNLQPIGPSAFTTLKPDMVS
jgi:hypothetical protein